MIPLMPKGVEHAQSGVHCAYRDVVVMIPLMPKGVEHDGLEDAENSGAYVMIPLMPKGVEHRLSRGKFCELRP